ncbi:MAG TPA: hypothetical protein VIK69_02760 [Methylophilaceae bacterium]
MCPANLNSIQHYYLYLQQRKPAFLPLERHLPYLFCSAAAMLAGVIAFGSMANAAMPSGLEVFEALEEIPDGELQHMRGKFVSNNQVLYFGVEMVSRWQTEMGTTVIAGASLDIDFRAGGNAQPVVSYVPTVSIVQQVDAQGQENATSHVYGGAGLANVSGVSQSIQVAGRSNHVLNDISMQVMLAPADGGGSAAAAAGTHGGMAMARADDGTIATVRLGSNSLDLGIAVPGQGEVLQQIRSQGMFQSARIGGDLNQVHNVITMHIGINGGIGEAWAGAHTALQSLMDIQQRGMF